MVRKHIREMQRRRPLDALEQGLLCWYRRYDLGVVVERIGVEYRRHRRARCANDQPSDGA
jgi:hypothetical protein